MQQSSFSSNLGIFHISDHDQYHTTTTTDHDHDDHHQWSFEENKTFEIAIAELSKDFGSPDFMIHQIASRIPGKTVSQIKQHLKALTEDIEMIEKGLIPIPNYVENSSNHDDNHIRNGAETKSTNPPRRKGIPWTKKEHELFLKGLDIYGKGDWRSISRLCVVTRTPTQVASHAQKYYLRLQNPGARQTKEAETAMTRRANKSLTHFKKASMAASSLHHVSSSHESQTHLGHGILSPSPCPSCQRPFSS